MLFLQSSTANATAKRINNSSQTLQNARCVRVNLDADAGRNKDTRSGPNQLSPNWLKDGSNISVDRGLMKARMISDLRTTFFGCDDVKPTENGRNVFAVSYPADLTSNLCHRLPIYRLGLYTPSLRYHQAQ